MVIITDYENLVRRRQFPARLMLYNTILYLSVALFHKTIIGQGFIIRRFSTLDFKPHGMCICRHLIMLIIRKDKSGLTSYSAYNPRQIEVPQIDHKNITQSVNTELRYNCGQIQQPFSIRAHI